MAVGELASKAHERARSRGQPPESTAHVPDAVAPPPRHPRFPLFDGLRAIAVLLVVLGHVPEAGALSDPWRRLSAHLNLGVVIFFIISGFLLYRPFIARRAGGAPAPDIADYAKRRFLRIFPAYWLVLTVLILIPSTNGVYGGNPLAQYALVQTLPILGAPSCYGFSLCVLAQTWSLVVELSFYLVLPVYALVAIRLTRGRSPRQWMRAELGILAVLAAVSAFLQYGAFGAARSLWVTSTVIGFFFLFAAGMGLAVASVALGGASRRPCLVRLTAARPTVTWLIAIVAYVVLSLSLPEFATSRVESLVNWIGLGLVAFLIVIPAVFGDESEGFPRRLLADPAVAWIGLVSYGIFLWHPAVVYQVGSKLPLGLALTVTLVLSVALAAASYYVVERPILRFKYRRSRDLFAGIGGAPQNETGV